jgi:hypothetical protein
MQVEIVVKVGEYSLDTGVRIEWKPGFEIEVQALPREVIIRANAAGLTSLAQHFLTLAQQSVPPDTHVHLDASRELADASVDLVIERS